MGSRAWDRSLRLHFYSLLSVHLKSGILLKENYLNSYRRLEWSLQKGQRMRFPRKALLAPISGSHSGGTRVLERGSLPLVLHGLPRGSVQKHRQSGSTAQTRPATRPVASVPHSGGAFGRVSSTEHGASLSRGWATQPPDETEHSRLWTLPPRGLDLSSPPGWADPASSAIPGAPTCPSPLSGCCLSFPEGY